MDSVILTGLIAALDFMTVLYWTLIVLKVAVALGFVIFVHELGHFLVARACGVRCDKFMVGFDIGGYKLSRKWGETEYGIGILPLGGYVKMFGQDDDPAHIAEQMKKSQVSAASTDAVEVTGPNGEKFLVDRRSYLGKSVPQRMAIISAGVIMNIIFAFIFAVIAFGIGVPYMPSIVSETVPGSPAWQADIEPGDEIIQLGDRENPSFNQLRGGVTLGDLERGIPTLVRRAEDGRVDKITLRPERDRGLATIGIISPRSLTLADEMPVAVDSAASRAKLISPPVDDVAEDEARFQGGDRIIAVNDEPVASYRELAAVLTRSPEEALRVTVARPVGDVRPARPAGAAAETGIDTVPDRNAARLTFDVPTQPMRDFGLVMKMGPIAAIQTGSPADRAGIQVGDVITRVDGRAMAGERDDFDTWDAASLPDHLRRAALDGREVELTLGRGASRDGQVEEVMVRVMPELPRQFATTLPAGAPMAAGALGIAYHVENEVVAIVPDSPAEADVRPGDTITHVQFILPEAIERREGVDSAEIGPDAANWPMLLSALQRAPKGTEVELRIAREATDEPHTVRLKPVVRDELFVPDRGFVLQPIERIRIAETFGQQLQYGFEETTEALGLIFRFLQKLGTQVPVTALGGPVTIARVAGLTAAEGTATFLIFLTVLSANLAVINFLPIPLLDGGHMVFLAYEGIRGRPAPEKLVVAMHTAGFVFIVGLMLFVLGLDVGLIPRNL